MNPVLWPCLALVLAAWAIAAQRVYELAWRAPVDAPALSAALLQRLARGELGRALALCQALERSWAADCAATLLSADTDRAALQFSIDELRAMYGARAQSGVGALRALGRMAFPLALGTAIVAMSGAFSVVEVAGVQRALSTALQCMTLGLMASAFCHASAGALMRQGQARMREISGVCRAIREAFSAAPPCA